MPSINDALSTFPHDALAPVTVVCGHYGVGKTSLSVSLAIDAAAQGMQVALADLDVVNPYFRASDNRAELEAAGVRVIAPVLAGTNLDAPNITNEAVTAAEWANSAPGRLLIVDAGGDDAGATVLGRFAREISQADHRVLYVVNRNRGFDHTPVEAAAMLRDIEQAARLRATAVVGNTHLKADTDSSTIQEGAAFAEQVARELGLPLSFVTAPRERYATFTRRETEGIRQVLGPTELYLMGIYVRTPWE